MLAAAKEAPGRVDVAGVPLDASARWVPRRAAALVGAPQGPDSPASPPLQVGAMGTVPAERGRASQPAALRGDGGQKGPRLSIIISSSSAPGCSFLTLARKAKAVRALADVKGGELGCRMPLLPHPSRAGHQ